MTEAPSALAAGRLLRIGRWLANGGAASLLLIAMVAAAIGWIALDIAPRFNTAPVLLPLQHTLWNAYGKPTISTIEVGPPAELGVLFRPTVAGTVVGVRFYKLKSDSGPHVGSLWTAKGKQLAAVTFSDETDSGWQEAHFATPIQVDANRLLVVSYFGPVAGSLAVGGSLPDGDAPMRSGSQIFRRPPAGDRPASVYLLGTPGFPSNDAGERAIWVDVVFVPETESQ